MVIYLKETLKTSNLPLMIKFDNVTVNYGDLTALENITFNLYEKDFLYIVGPNGGGKSTLIKTILGLVKPMDGDIQINSKSIGYLPQTLNTKNFFPITVNEVIYSGFIKQKLIISKDDQKLIDRWLERMDLNNVQKKLIGELSGGQQQRIFLIRALISNPKILILDEPTSALDPNFRFQFYNLINELNEQGTTIIFITHDLSSELNQKSSVLEVDRTSKYYKSLKEYQLHYKGDHHHV